MTKPNQAQLGEFLSRGIAEAIDRAHLEGQLRSGKKLRLKYGIDPTGAQLHLGHAVPLRVLRRFQDVGHTVVLIVGDFTARIGDPSGRDIARPALTKAQARENARTYTRQAFTVLRKEKTEVRRNSEWFKKFSAEHVLREAMRLSAGWIFSHETFKKRLREGKALSLHEILYPLFQSYDSIAVKADIEFGAVDQKFNLLTARELMKAHGLEPQDVVLTKYLTGLDGQKMSKSLKNYIALEEEPFEMFGKIMSLPDEALPEYFELATDVPTADFDKMKWSGTEARNTKMFLARKIVEQYHGQKASQQALRQWNDFVKGATPAEPVRLKDIPRGSLLEFFIANRITTSKSEAQRIIEQGGVKVNDTVVQDWRRQLKIGDIVTVGKKKKTYSIK